MDGTVRYVQHLIMLGVLSAQSANEPAPRAPSLPYCLHFATQPLCEGLAPEEPPTLAIRPSSALASAGRGARVLAQRRQPFRVDPSELPEPKGQDKCHRTVEIPGVAVLDDLLEFVPQRRRNADVRGACIRGPAHQRPHRFRAIAEIVRRSELFEERLFFQGEAHTKKTGRGSVGSSSSHGV
jgi:hypothetical protein